MKKTLPFQVMQFCGGLVFFAPVATLLRTSRGVTLSQFFLLQALLSVTVFLVEIPAGVLTDRIGYKKAILLSQTLLFFARAVFLFADHIAYFIVEAIVEAFAVCFLSGTGEAYLYELCREEQDKERFVVESARADAWGTAGFILSTLCYAGLYHFTGLNGLVAATELAGLGSILAVLCMPRVPERRPGRERGPVRRAIPKLPAVLWRFMALDAMVGLAGLVVNFLYVEKLRWSGIPVEWMTPVILGYSALQMLVPKVIAALRGRKDAKVYRGASILGAALLAGLFCFNGCFCVVFMMLTPFLLNIVGIIQYKYENLCIDRLGLEYQRATLLSMMNMGNNLLEIVFLLLSAVISSGQGNGMFLFAGGVVLFLALRGSKWIAAEESAME